MARRDRLSKFEKDIYRISLLEGHLFRQWYMRLKNKEVLDLWDIGFDWSGKTCDLGKWSRLRAKEDIMNKKTLASMLHGRKYRNEITKEEEKIARDNRLVVVFGGSDDLVELRGFVYDELGAGNGTSLPFSNAGLIVNECDDDRCPYYHKKVSSSTKIIVKWNNDCPVWSYKTVIPHDAFDIMDGDDVFCRGIVFCIDDVV